MITSRPAHVNRIAQYIFGYLTHKGYDVIIKSHEKGEKHVEYVFYYGSYKIICRLPITYFWEMTSPRSIAESLINCMYAQCVRLQDTGLRESSSTVGQN